VADRYRKKAQAINLARARAAGIKPKTKRTPEEKKLAIAKSKKAWHERNREEQNLKNRLRRDPEAAKAKRAAKIHALGKKLISEMEPLPPQEMTQASVQTYFDFNGKRLVWKLAPPHHQRRIGQEAGHVHAGGHVTVRFAEKTVALSRLVLLYHGLTATREIVYFSDGNPLNCALDNLRYDKDAPVVCKQCLVPKSTSEYKKSSGCVCRECVNKNRNARYHATKVITRRSMLFRPGFIVCKDCDKEKPHAAYTVSRSSVTGHNIYCRECRSIRDKKARAENPERSRAHVKAYHAKNRDALTAKMRARNAKYREELPDIYLRQVLQKKYGPGEYNQAQVDVERALITFWRATGVRLRVGGTGAHGKAAGVVDKRRNHAKD
jgi:hypothetical protein